MTGAPPAPVNAAPMPIQGPGRLPGKRSPTYQEKVTLRGGSPSFTRWINAVIDVIPIDLVSNSTGTSVQPTRRKRIAKLVAALKTLGHRGSINTIYGYAEGKGASVYRVWDIGEALFLAGITWMSGALAISAVHDYSWHLLGWLGTLLSHEGRSENIRSMWPYLSRVVCDREAAYPDRDRHYFIELAETLSAFTYPDIFKKPDQSKLVLLPWQRALADRAWHSWTTTRHETNDFPDIIRLSMTLQRTAHFDDMHAQLASSIVHHFVAEWMLNVETAWDAPMDAPVYVDQRFSVIDNSLK